mmetsp:Transcript_87/g.290  ORF Transcript_87/g.290 Transcript_87/m.290 type:complete len:429 (-) Transcript_87:89-1375(-)|eukprot:CAMPEP_0206140942 /NCGR_PEP_ID=MMETSP1473-20131121/11289_1 /ASSEMBLY_ACC=CAM_ASM_001109 /TAXON_ID=1461547 /ORGANISM="Stichococcus sp, Strain RCC1054" /LENGTH=428 /DNA_ID=CAMNT_0053535305 /DNA_START=107 /DNA_END=1393 /DNA_ORIENTATION=+
MDPEDELEDADSSEDDELLCELDVFMSHNVLTAKSEKLYVLQSPLRAPWRPYELDTASKVQLKPTAGRLTMDIPLQTRGSNVNPDALPAMRLKQLSLVSQPTELSTSFAIGTIRDGKVILAPFIDALQLRPSMAHVDVAAAGGKGGKSAEAESPEEEDDVKPQLQPVKVNVQRRETERQAEMRLKSYSYHAQQEEHEPWIELELLGPDSVEAAGVWDAITSPPLTSVPLTMSRDAFLDAVTPGAGVSELTGAGISGSLRLDGVGTRPQLGQPQRQLQPAGSGSLQRPVSPAALEALPAALAELFSHRSVANLQCIRQFLTSEPDVGEAKLATAASDQTLTAALMNIPGIVTVKGRFLKLDATTKDLAMRQVILDLFRTKDSVRRGDVQAAWEGSRKDRFPDGSYQRIIKLLANHTTGNIWHLDGGEPG